MGEITHSSPQGSYFRLYTTLFQDRRFKSMRLESKVLYSALLSRNSLSEQNNWRDDRRRTFVYCTVEEVGKLLGCGRCKAMDVLKELERYGLITRQKQGRGKPDRIYVWCLQDICFLDPK